ncbi:type VI secretion system lipoprotein TssJ [Pseudomonas sp. RIT-To-2]|uniref:type VI secretion system lipoprotein TssJ n=1 Tax=Pseudomonas sp. RIT-To-2 TaxID=3462541 RepID=UPI002413139C
MSRTVFKAMMTAALSIMLSGCGVTQAVSDGTASTARAIFHKQVDTLHLDFSGREALNTVGPDMSALSVTTLVRVYQLRDAKAFEKASYDRIVANSESLLGPDLLNEHAVVVKPAQGAVLNVPLAKEAKFVMLVALFRQPDTQLNTWRLTLRRDQLDPDHARRLELVGNRLTLQPLAKE